MKEYWYHEGAGGEAWMAEDAPDSFCRNDRQGPYYLVYEVDAEIDALRQTHRENVNLLRDDLARVQQSLKTTSDALSQMSVTCSLLRQQNERLMNRSE